MSGLRVAFDGQIFRQQRHGGISRYFCELARELSRLPDVQAHIVAPHHRNAYLEALDPTLRHGWPSRAWPRLGKLSRAAGRLLEWQLMCREPPHVVHATYYGACPLKPAHARRVVTVYDMIHERFPEHFSPGDTTAADKRRAVAEADHVICISHSTRADLIERLGVPEAKVSVTHLASSLAPPVDTGAPSAGTGAPYLLYVGERGGYKNFAAVAQALAASPALRELRLVCFGGGPLKAPEWELLRALGLGVDRVEGVQGDDDRLARAYAGASAFVYPSLAEGFGIPPLEAMRCGCPVVCSDTSSLPEVVGPAAERFDPRKPETIRVALERVLLSPTRRAELMALGHAQGQRFSWQRCAQETRTAYQRALDAPLRA